MTDVTDRSVSPPLPPPTLRCWDCGVEIGVPHLDGCDVARCLVTGVQQRLSCLEDHDHGDDRHTGYWPGVLECREFNWFTDPSLPGFSAPTEDLNRLALAAVIGEVRWSREDRRFYLVESPA
jgi:hypothetical protein